MSARARELERWIEHVDRAIGQLEHYPDPTVREGAMALAEAMQALHHEALRRLLALIDEERGLRERALSDPVIANVLLLHGLATSDERRIVEAVLDEIRPTAHGHGGDIELIDVADGIVHLRLHGSCAGCPASLATLRGGIEVRLRERLPGFVGLEVKESSAPAVVVFRGDATACVVPAERIAELEARLKAHAPPGTT